MREKFIKYSSYVGDNIDQMSKGMVSVQFSFEGNRVGTKEVCSKPEVQSKDRQMVLPGSRAIPRES